MRKIFISLSILFIATISANAQVKWTVYNNENSPLIDAPYLALEFDKEGTLWVGGGGLYSFDGLEWRQFLEDEDGLIHSSVRQIAVDANNMIWIGTFKGLSVFDGAEFTNFDTSNSDLPGETIYALGIDRENFVWVASQNGSFGYQGISVYNGDGWQQLQNLPQQVKERKLSEFIFTSSSDAWIASDPGLTRYMSGNFEFYPKATTGLWSSSAIALDEKKGIIWAAGFDGILKYEKQKWKVVENEELGLSSGILYYRIFVDGDYLWMGTSDGFFKYNTITNKIVAKYNDTNSPLETNGVTDIAKDKNGDIWVTNTGGVVKMSGASTDIKLTDNFSNLVNIYPNPSQGKVYVETAETSGESQIVITDICGRTIIQQGIKNTNTILDISYLTKGIYLVKVFNNGRLQSNSKLILN